jgi:hypothetical protein
MKYKMQTRSARLHPRASTIPLTPCSSRGTHRFPGRQIFYETIRAERSSEMRSTSGRRSLIRLQPGSSPGRPTSSTSVGDRRQVLPRAVPGCMHHLLLFRRLLRILCSVPAGTHGHGAPLINAAAAGTGDAAVADVTAGAADAAGSHEVATMPGDRGAAACQRQRIMIAVTSLHNICRPSRRSLRLGLPERWRQAREHYRVVLADVVLQMR